MFDASTGVQGGLRLSAGAFLANWAAVMLVTLVAQTFGLLFGATIMDAKNGQTITTVVMLVMNLVRLAPANVTRSNSRCKHCCPLDVSSVNGFP